MASSISDFIKKLELASRTTLSPPNQVSATERKEAEEFLLSFQTSKSPFDICKAVLENSGVDYVQYRAAVTLRDAVIREWIQIDESSRHSLQQFILDYVTRKQESLSNFVRAVLIQVFGIMLKRSSVRMKNAKHREELHQQLNSAIQSGIIANQLIACEILTAMCTEFSNTDKSSNIGITWLQHNECKRHFEDFDLKIIFSLVLEVLKHFHISKGGSSALNQSEAKICQKFLAIAELVLTWNFLSTSVSRRSNLMHSSDCKVLLKPPADWKTVFQDSSMLHSFFDMHSRCRQYPELYLLSSSCLAQLATLQGPCLNSMQDKCNYIKNFVMLFLGTYGSGDFTDFEVFGVSVIVKNLIEANNMKIWKENHEMQALFSELLNCFTKITCNTCKGAAKYEALDSEDNIYTDALDNVMDAWTTLITGIDNPNSSSFISPYASLIFETYIHLHLAPPEGSRISIEDDMSDINELEEDDHEKFCRQLMSLAYLGRSSLDKTLPLISGCIEKRAAMLNNEMLILLRENSEIKTADAQMKLENLFEDLHWLVLVAGHLLADETKGETATIPSSIIRHSIAQTHTIDRNLSLQVLGTPHQDIFTVLGSAASSIDDVIRCFSSVIRLCQIHMEAMESRKAEFLSPQLAQDLSWFLLNFCSSFLYFQENIYEEISPVISSAFGQDSEGGRWNIHFVVRFVCVVLTQWNSETKLSESIAELLLSIVSSKERCLVLAECEEFWKLGLDVCLGHPPYSQISPSVAQKIISSIVVAGTLNPDSPGYKYCQKIMEIIKTKYNHLTSDIHIKKKDLIHDELLAVLDLIKGVAGASSIRNSNELFGFLSMFLTDGHKLIFTFKNCQTVIVSVLELFVNVVEKGLSFLPETKCLMLYEWTFSLLRTYVSIPRNAHDKDSEEDAFHDISLIMELLSHMLMKDLIDCSESEDNHNKVSVAEVVIYGLGIILPQINSNLLMYPALCGKFYKLVTFLCEIYPEKVEKLPPEIFNPFLYTLQIGLTSYGNDNCKLSLEALQSLTEHCRDSGHASLLHASLNPFVKMVFDVVIVHAADMEIMRTAAEAFYTLLTFNYDHALKMLSEMVDSQVDASYKELLSKEFTKLVLPKQATSKLDRAQKSHYIRILEEVVFNVRSILCVK